MHNKIKKIGLSLFWHTNGLINHKTHTQHHDLCFYSIAMDPVTILLHSNPLDVDHYIVDIFIVVYVIVRWIFLFFWEMAGRMGSHCTFHARLMIIHSFPGPELKRSITDRRRRQSWTTFLARAMINGSGHPEKTIQVKAYYTTTTTTHPL